MLWNSCPAELHGGTGTESACCARATIQWYHPEAAATGAQSLSLLLLIHWFNHLSNVQLARSGKQPLTLVHKDPQFAVVHWARCLSPVGRRIKFRIASEQSRSDCVHECPVAPHDKLGTAAGAEYSGNHIGSDSGPPSCGSRVRDAAGHNLFIVCGNQLFRT